MSRFHRIAALILTAAGGCLIAGSAQAQKPPPFVELDSITVTAPKTVEQNRDGVVGQLVTMSVKVPYSDLNMQTPQGVAELNKRVSQAAEYVCQTLANRYPTGDPDPYDCAKLAVGDAKPQVVLASAPR